MYFFVHNLHTRQLLGVGQSKPICPWVSVLITIKTQISTFIILEPIIHLFTSLSHFFLKHDKGRGRILAEGFGLCLYQLQNTKRHKAIPGTLMSRTPPRLP